MMLLIRLIRVRECGDIQRSIVGIIEKYRAEMTVAGMATPCHGLTAYYVTKYARSMLR